MLCIPALLIKGPTLPSGPALPLGGTRAAFGVLGALNWGATLEPEPEKGHPELVWGTQSHQPLHTPKDRDDFLGPQGSRELNAGVRGTPFLQVPRVSLTSISLQVRTADMGGYSTSMDFTQAVIDALEVH